MLRMTAPMGSASEVDAGQAARMRAVIEELADTRYAGRRVGTPGGFAAARWLLVYLGELGATAHLDEFEVSGAVREVYSTPVLRWSDGRTAWSLVFRREFCEHLASSNLPTVLNGRIVGPDGPASGAWVVDTTFSPDRIEIWAAAGAAGILVPRGTDEQGWMPKMLAGPPVRALPVLAVRRDIHHRMTVAARTGAARAAASVPVRTADVTAANVHGVFRTPALGAPALLLTAHYDGVGDDPDGTRFPAAADNASGVAVALETARQLHSVLLPEVGLTVALLDGEEVGAKGSEHHAPEVPEGTYVINIDGAGALHEAAAVEAGGPAHTLLAALDQAGRSTGVALRAAPMPSDNRRYAAAGLPAIGIGMGIPGYQTPAETPDRVDAATLDQAVRLVMATAEHLFGAGRRAPSASR